LPEGTAWIAPGKWPGAIAPMLFQPIPGQDRWQRRMEPPSNEPHCSFRIHLSRHLNSAKVFLQISRRWDRPPAMRSKRALRLSMYCPYHPLTRMGYSVDLPFAVLLILRSVADGPASFGMQNSLLENSVLFCSSTALVSPSLSLKPGRSFWRGMEIRHLAPTHKSLCPFQSHQCSNGFVAELGAVRKKATESPGESKPHL
jgi:hypothetical protein